MIILGLFILVLMATIVYGVVQLYRSREKPREAVQSAIYVAVYPVIAYAAWVMRPIPSWLVAPLIVAAVPWLFSGVYLNEIVKDPGIAKEGEFVGFPYGYWIWGGILSVALGAWLG